MFDLQNIIKGYSDEQYSEALTYIMANFLKENGIINMQEFQEYHKSNINELLNEIVERDKKEAQEKINKLRGEINERRIIRKNKI